MNSEAPTTVFSTRVPGNRQPNRLTMALDALGREGAQVIDLTGSNPTLAGFDYRSDLLQPLAHSRGLTYQPEPRGLPAARRAVAADYARRGVSVDPERITLTASTSEAYSLLFKVLCDAGDEVLVPTPSYPLFEHLTRLDVVGAVPYELEYQTAWRVDVGSLERALSERTRAVLAVSPNNPTGSFLHRDEFDAIAELCAARGLALIVDEVFADYVLDDHRAADRAVPLHDAQCLVFSLAGLSKSIGLPQVKLGWMAASGPESLVEEALARLEFACDAYLSASTPVQAAAADLLEGNARARVAIQSRVRHNDRVLRELISTRPALHALASEAGWSAVVRVPSLASEEDLVVGLLTHARVLVQPGYFFDFPHEAFLVVSLLAPESCFAEGLGRVIEYLDSLAALGSPGSSGSVTLQGRQTPLDGLGAPGKQP